MKRAGIIGYLFDDNNELWVLATLQMDGCWSFPKGQCENGESVLTTAYREFAEETGYARKIRRVHPEPIVVGNIYLFVTPLNRSVPFLPLRDDPQEVRKVQWIKWADLKRKKNVNDTVRKVSKREIMDRMRL